MLMHEQENKNLHVFKNFVNQMKGKFGLKIEVIKSNNKINRKKTLCWLHIKYIKFKPSVPRTQEQNSIAEHSGGIIMKKARAM